MRSERHNTTLAGRRPQHAAVRKTRLSRTFTWRVHISRVAINVFSIRLPAHRVSVYVGGRLKCTCEKKGSVGRSHRRVSRSVYDIDPGCSMRVTLPSAAPSLGPEISRMPSMTRLSRNGDAAARWRGRILPDPFWPKETQNG